ncbi:MAG TPA: R3H domain-containing nucleic acid-binding protein [Thermoanaerobaculia bacterium]|nr:R3H domain-containing nucleic acid-binding protein [Thermoanaerobaculia bacterium]
MAQRFEGRNLDEALDHAAETLGVDRHQLIHSVILEKRGFLGGMKRVVIEADVNEGAAPPETPAAPPPIAATASAHPPPRERARGPRGGGGDRGGRGGNRRDDRPRGPRRERRDDDLRPGDFEHFAAVEVPEQGPESEAAKVVREWCEEVIDYARFELDVRTEENEEQIIVRLYGRDARRMTEEHGEALDALQVLANKALIGRKTEKDIELDCDGFKSRRHDDLEQRARDAAERVRSDGREQLLPAMTPIERRIVHMALQDDADVTTESRGEGFYKRVAIVRRAAAQ